METNFIKKNRRKAAGLNCLNNSHSSPPTPAPYTFFIFCIFLFALCILPCGKATAQGVAINTTGAAADISAMLDVTSTNAGLLIPRMTLAQRNAIATPATSLLVYQTDGTPGYYYYNGSAWVSLFSNNTGWALTGNAGTNFSTNFLGTTDNVSLRFRTNNTQKMIIDSVGNVGIGTTNMLSKLQVVSTVSGSLAGFGSSTATSHGLVTLNNGNNNYAYLAVEGSGAGRMDVSGTIDNAAVFGSRNQFPVQLIAGNDAKFTILHSSGNVGIGTTSPEARLHVAGSGDFGSFAFISEGVYGAHIQGSTEGWTHGFLGNFKYNFTTEALSYTPYSKAGEGIKLDGAAGIRFFSSVSGAVGNFSPIERMRITKTGNVGIGIITPALRLHVLGTSGTVGAMGNIQSYSEGVFENNGHAAIHIVSNSATNSHVFFGDQNDAVKGWIRYINAGDAMDFLVNSLVAMTIDNAQRVGIGTLAPTALLSVNGAANNTTGVWGVFSDRRLKRDIEPLQGALSKILQLQGVSFCWKDSAQNAQLGRVRGFIAQDVEKVIPEWVKTTSNGFKQLETIGMDAMLVEAIKEQQQQIKKLQIENQQLKTENNKYQIEFDTRIKKIEELMLLEFEK